METILVNYEGHVATITINRPKALNALSTQVLTELNQALDEVAANKDVYALVITGAGEKSFVAGADIAEMKDKSVEEAATYGKFELAMSCDIRVASENAVFGQPEVGLGITPGFGGTQRLARLVGTGIAKEMIYTARNIKADRAYAIGLVNSVVPADELMAAVMKMANGIAKNAPLAVAYSKKAINNGLQTDIDGGIAIEVEEFSNCFATEDQTYGMTCFLEKTKDKKFSNK